MTLKLLITGSDFVAGNFNARNRYLRGSALGARFPISKGPTLSIVSYGGGNGVFRTPVVRYSVNGFVMQRTTGNDESTNHVDAGNFNAVVQLVKT